MKVKHDYSHDLPLKLILQINLFLNTKKDNTFQIVFIYLLLNYKKKGHVNMCAYYVQFI